MDRCMKLWERSARLWPYFRGCLLFAAIVAQLEKPIHSSILTLSRDSESGRRLVDELSPFHQRCGKPLLSKPVLSELCAC